VGSSGIVPGDTFENGRAVLRYIQSRRELVEALERGEPVSFSDGPNQTAPDRVFPLRNDGGLVALLAVNFPPGSRSSRAVFSRIERLCDAAEPLLAKGNNSASELEELVNPLADSNRQLHALAQVRSHAVRNGMHDLQTPLVAALGYARLLLREEAGPLTAVQREYLGTILENMQRMTGELKGLAELAKPEPLRFTFFDLATVWPDVLQKVRARARGTAVQIETEFSHRPFPIAADAAMLSEALDSIVGYVMRRTAEGGRIAVGFERNEEIVVRIASNRLKQTREDEPAGPGTRTPDELAAARRALRLHGGGVPVSRSSGKGFTMTVSLPVISWKEQGGLEAIHEQALDSCGG
jgi:signal transduction histidine kinase